MRRLKFGNKNRRKDNRKKTRGYNFFRFGFFILLALHGVGLYVNYDYWIFKMLISQHYIFTDALDTLYVQALGEENFHGNYFQDFDRMVMAVVTQRIREINQDRYTYLYSPSQFRVSREIEREDAGLVHFEALTDEVGYLFIPNIHSYTRRFVNDNRSEIAQFPYLILDLRGNYGGLLADFYRIADLFVEHGASVGYERTRWPIFTSHIEGRRVPYFNFEHIIILQNERTASAAEGLILALQGNLPNVTSIGTTTFGKGIGQVTIPLIGGSAIRASVLLVEGPGSESIHNVGITPDIFYDGDALAYALDLLTF
ncbi:MAG: S41 family peptidase [Defluviitaleaceae bacterium]|nr:S41 family peptidase [Defluviitaleaceae bacterium]